MKHIIFILSILSLISISSAHYSIKKQVQDKQQITDVISAYTIAWDFHHASQFKHYFTNNAKIINTVVRKVVKRDTLKQFIISRSASEKNEIKNHWVGGHNLSIPYFVHLTPKTAKTITVYNYFCYSAPIGKQTCNIRGSYEDNWIKTSKGWRIQKRFIHHFAVNPSYAKMQGVIK